VSPEERRVDPADWVDAARAARDEGHRWFDRLSVVDEGPEDGADRFSVSVHAWDRTAHRSVLLRTTVTGSPARLASLAEIWAGAAWHEREAAEMFGLVVDGHPDPRPLLLPDGFAGHPLRKDFALASRATTDWPGAHEPAEHGPAAKAPSRRRPTAPGVPSWDGGERA
jgi:NADH-quinone oxidoreductase subunit C